MKRKSKGIVAAIVLIGVLAAGGAAFTASNTLPATTAGYGSSTISGADAHSIVYTLSGDGQTITGATLQLHTNGTPNNGDMTSGYVVKAGWNGAAPLTTCTVDTSYHGTGTDGTNTQFLCDFSGLSGGGQNTTNATAFNVVVTNS